MKSNRFSASSRTFQRARDIVNLPQSSIFRISQTCLAPQNPFLKSILWDEFFFTEPTLRILALLQSLTFENGKLHYSETKGPPPRGSHHLLVTKPGWESPPFASQVSPAQPSSWHRPLPLANVPGLGGQGFSVIEIWPPLVTVFGIKVHLTSRAPPTNPRW